MKLVIKILFLYSILLCIPSVQAQVSFSHSPSRLQLYPREANDSADVVISGQVTQSNFDQIIFTYHRDNVITDSSIVNLSFSGGNNGSFSKSYRIRARKSLYSFRVFLVDNNVRTRVLTADSVVCGDVFIINGQSNAVANPTGGGVTDAPYLWLRSFGNQTSTGSVALADTTWGLGQGTSGATNFSIGVWGIRLGKLIADQMNVPICIINGAKSGSLISQHLPAANPLLSSTIYGRLLYRAQKAKVDQKVKGIFWFQGESDGGSADASLYQSRFTTLSDAWHDHFPALRKIFVVQTHPGCIDDLPEHSDVRETIRKLPDFFPDVVLTTTVGLAGFDGCHFNIPGYQALAANLEDQVERDIYGISVPGNIDPPDIVSAYYSNGTNTEISLAFNQQIFWPALYNGYNLKDYFYFNTSVTVVSGSATGNIVKLTLSAPSSATKISYIPNQYYNNSNTQSYNGPWLMNDNELGAFTFFEFPITTGLVISSSTTSLCGASSILMTANKTGTNYRWYRNGNQISGATSNSYSATQAGSYYFTLVESGSGALTSNTLAITSGISAPLVVASGGVLSYCPGSSVALSTTLAYSSYLWSNGQTTSGISVSSAGNYTVRVSNSQGCTAVSSPVSVTQYTSPVASISAPSNGFCAGSSLILTASSNDSYLWSTGASTQTISINSAGTYTVTITDIRGCTDASSPIVISSYPLPTATISYSATSFCDGNSLALTSSVGSSYLWSTGATTRIINTTVGGTFSVTVTEGNGCFRTSNALVITKNTLPVASIIASAEGFCPGGSVTLTGSGGNSFLWSSGSNAPSITTNSAGTFTVMVTDVNGCTDVSNPINIIEYSSPLSTISPSETSFCSGDSVLLSASSGISYLWSNGSTTQHIYAVDSGTYHVTVSENSGCVAVSEPVSLTKYTPIVPTISSSSVSFCNGDSLLLSSSDGVSYSWSTGQVSKDIFVYNTGNYYVVVTDINGCTASSVPLTVTKNTPAVPTILNTSSSFCTGDSLQLIASSGLTFLWSDGQTSQSIYITSGGIYDVTTTDNFGCTAVSAAVTIVEGSGSIPSITLPGSAFCQGDSVLLSASSGNSYLWSNGSTTQHIYAVDSGTYHVAVSYYSGCVAVSEPVSLTKYTSIVPTISSSSVNFCNGDSLLLSSSDGVSYSWSTGQVSKDIFVYDTGNYYVIVTDINGCTASSVPLTLTEHTPAEPTILNTSSSFCTGDSLQLIASSGVTFLWSDGQTSQSIYITAGGIYDVTVTDNFGCTAVSSAVTIVENTGSIPSIALNRSAFCQGDSVLLSASSGNSYLWSNGSTTQHIYAVDSGTYHVAVSDNSGCVAISDPVEVFKNIPSIPNASSVKTIFCEGEVIALTVSYGNSFLWTTGETTQTIETSTPGTYSVTVTDGNGCIVQSNAVNLSKNIPPLPILSSSKTNICDGESLQLSASSGIAYLWSTGETSADIYVSNSGNYSVTVTNNFGCSATSIASSITKINPDIPTIISAGFSFCEGDSLLLTSSSDSSYLWSTGSTSQSVYLKNGGVYTVTVSNVLGCTAVSSPIAISMNIPIVPTVTSPNAGFCDGDSLLLTASEGVSYLWSTGSTSQEIYTKSSGSFFVTVYDTNGCAAGSIASVIVMNSAALPVINTSSTNFCSGDSFLLVSSASISYLWSNGSTTRQISTNAAGTYTVTITDGNGCTARSNPITLSENTPLIPTIIVPLNSFCEGDSITLTTSSGISYLWSNGNTTQVINTDIDGQYVVSVTDINGCTGISDPVLITKNTPILPTVSSINTSFCSGDSLQLTASAGSSYLWSTGETTPQIYCKESGSFIVTVTDNNGCIANSNPYEIEKHTPPPALASSNALSFCEGDSILITTSAGASFLWSTGETTPEIYVKESGNYNVSITDNNECVAVSNVLSITKNIISPAIISSSGSSFCAGSSLLLNASSGSSYLWSNGETAQVVNTDVEGQYIVTITDINGCTAVSDPLLITKNTPALPSVSSINTSFCNGDSLQLTATTGNLYLWSTGETTQQIYSKISGSFVVTVTDNNGCIASSIPYNIVKNTPAPAIASSIALSFCQGDSMLVTSSGGSSFLWSTGETTPEIYVNESGNYHVTITDNNECVAVSNILSITENINSPASISATGSSFCEGSSLLLNASSGSSYLWSTGATVQSISIFNGGIYTVTVTDINGCSSQAASDNIIVNAPQVPVINSLVSEFCAGDSILLTSPSSVSYVWSTGSTSQSIYVVNSGSYIVTITDVNGCLATSLPKNITKYNLPTSLISSSTTNFCDGSSVLLNASAGGSTYLWSNGASSQSISINNTGTFTVTITDNHGCSAISDALSVTKYAPVNVSILSSGTNFCDGDSLLLAASNGISFLWANGAVTQTIYARETGSFVVTVTNNQGCTGISPMVSVTKNTPPFPTISSNGTTFCNGSSLLITASTGSGYLWSNGATTQSINVANSGVFTVSVTNNLGCSASSAPISLTRNTPSIPAITSSGTTFCDGGSMLLTASSGSAYLWSNGLTTQSITTANSGTFTVTVTNSFGCDAVSLPVAIIESTPSIPAINSAGTTFCIGSTLQLTASAGDSYLWSNGVTTQSASASNSGTYTVTVTNNDGCSAVSAPLTVTRNTPVVPTISSAGSTFCNGSSLLLTASGGSSYLWSNSATTQSVTATNTATFTVTVTNSFGCSAVSAPLTVTRNTPTTPTISSAGTIFCNGSTLLLTSSGGSSYLWSNSATTQSIAASNSGTFTVTVTNSFGCSAVSTPITVTRNTPSVPAISSAGTTFCNGDSLLLSASAGSAYLWSSGNTTQSIYVLNTGTFTVTVTNSFGCTAVSSPIIVTRNTPSIPTINSSGTTFCNGSSLLLTSSMGSSYLWSNGATTQSISATNSGTFTVSVTNASGCNSVSSPIAVTRNTPSIPTISSTGTTFCNGSSLVLTASSGSSYLWSNGATTQNITTTNSGTFTVTVTNSFGCSAVSTPITVTRNTPSIPTISSAGTTFCDGSSLLLTSSAGNSYLWSSGATTQSISATNSGTFTVTVTNSSGCSAASAPITVTRNTPATPTISSAGTVFCNGSSLLLTASAGSSYLWSSGATSQSISATNTATFTVTVTNSAGCSAVSAPLSVTRNTPSIPTISSAGTTFCNGSSLLLTASASTSYLWSTNATTRSISATTSGTYTLTVTNSSGCSSVSAPITITGGAAPVPTISSAGTTFCNGSSLALTASSASSYLWSTGATTQGISTINSGTFTVTVTYSSGCTAVSAPLVITKDTPVAPIISSAGTTFCIGSSLALTASSASSFLWSTGATTRSISTINAGTFTVTVTNSAGCSSVSNPVTITRASPVVPTINSATTSFCDGDSLLLTTSPGNSFAWSTGKTTASIYTLTAGTFMVTVTDNAGCTATSAGKVITRLTNNLPVITGPASQACEGSSITLTAPTSTAYLWSTGAMTKTISVNTAVGFTVTVTNSNGCSRKSNAYVPTYSPAPTITISPTGSVTICSGSSIKMTATSAAGNTFQWYKGNSVISGATLSSFTGTSAGAYKVRVTNTLGCTSFSATCTITFSSLPTASMVVTNQANNCSDTVVTLTANLGSLFTYQYQKDLVNIAGATARVYNTNARGSYRVIVYNQYGCSRTSAAMSIPIPNITASITASGSRNICTGDSVSFTANAGSGYTYQWQRNNVNIAGATLIKYTTKTAGSYRSIVSNAMGCSAISTSLAVTVTNCAREYSATNSEDVGLKFNIYPNPTINSFNIVLLNEVKSPIRYEIQDISGRVVKYGKMDYNEGTYQIGDDLRPGIYLFRAEAEGIMRIHRLEKIAE